MNNTKPLITVVVPTYNYAIKVTRAIDSLMKQTITNFECFIIDDESTDDTEKVVNEFIKHDKRFHYFKQKNSGVAVARNRGISKGTAPYVCCLDADDAIEPLFLEACIKGLEEDKDISIAYTRLRYILPNGKEGMGHWPDKFDYEQQLKGFNQIPTCCVFRRVVWERLGGYRKRYCPHGAGSEDAEFWLRTGAYGFKAKLVTDAPLFIYSFMSGRVSGNREYREVNWRSLHPWTEDLRHPFASVAIPRKQSHPVHQYDKPIVSVIIPIGPKHRELVFDALDSLDGQTFRDWEAVVVDDSGIDEPFEFDGFPDAMRAYPYVRLVKTEGNKGAGYARNRGAEAARAPLLLFLDADDTLSNDALEEMVIEWGLEQGIIYSDYAGKAYIDEKDLEKFPKPDILHYDKKSRLAVVRHHAAEYDCPQAILEPTKKMYIWNLISSLVPKAWHDEIKGFDENMTAWEDWDYWIRMARAGKCFYKLSKVLVIYRFYTGTRRESGLQDHKSLLQYMVDKYTKENNVTGCGCGGKKNPQVLRVQQVVRAVPLGNDRKENASMADPKMLDKNFVLCVYTHPNIGQHKVVGAVTKTVYGYRGGGSRFYVDRRDVAAQPNLYHIIEEVVEVPEAKVAAVPDSPVSINSTIPIDTDEAKEPVSTNIIEHEINDLQSVPGVTPGIRAQLEAHNIHSVDELLAFGLDGLQELKGIGEKRAASIMEFAKQYAEKHAE